MSLLTLGRTHPIQKNTSFSTLHDSTNMRAFGTVISGNRRKNDELSPYTRSAIISALAIKISPSKIAADRYVSR
jgi:hypothetical protein